MNWIEPDFATERCGEFIRRTLQAAGRESLVIGLSGGIDSAVAAGLAVHALGADKVRGILMPYRTSSAASLTDARAVAETLGLATEKVDITPAAEAFLALVEGEDRVRRGNIMARCRMIVLYDRSARDGSLVLGTGNRTEALLGYTTLFGDSACGLNPVGQLYKTEIRALSSHLGLPEAVLAKAPSADLWTGQSDEDELGVTYTEVDRLLVHMVDEGLGVKQLLALGFDEELIVRVQRRVRGMAFKRAVAPVCTFTGRCDPDLAERAAPAGWVPVDKDGGFH
jgi:NAD+ synthase